jgi:hypothetical protein
MSIPCNIFLPFHQCMKCFGVNEISIFEPKAKNTFPSFRTQRSINTASFSFFVEAVSLGLKQLPVFMMMLILCMSK